MLGTWGGGALQTLETFVDSFSLKRNNELIKYPGLPSSEELVYFQNVSPHAFFLNHFILFFGFFRVLPPGGKPLSKYFFFSKLRK